MTFPPCTNSAEHADPVDPQEIPAGWLVTFPAPATETVRNGWMR